MPFPSFGGRFRSRYGDFDKRGNQASKTEAPIRTLDADSCLLDIADGSFHDRKLGTVRVTCWPSPEGIDTGRRWGKYQSADAGIIPFRSRAQLSTHSARLHTYELDLFLCSNQPENSDALSFLQQCPFGQSGEPCAIHSDLSLVELPAPCDMAGPPSSVSGGHVIAVKRWNLRSVSGCSCGSAERAARWIWSANGHDPIVLNGGLALRHSRDPFLIACQVRGQALIQTPGLRLQRILKFGSENREPKWWKVEPKDSQDDLQASITELERKTCQLNSRDVAEIPFNPYPAPGQPSRPGTDGSQSHTFLSTTIGGNAQVIMGNFVSSGSSDHSFMNAQTPHYSLPPSVPNVPQLLG